MILSIVVAASENNAIGLKGELLWRLPKDTQFFKEVTWGHHVLMGRKSWEALPPKYRPLEGRTNIVVTRQTDYNAEGAKVVATVEDGIQFAKDAGEEELMIIGGGEIYKHVYPIIDKAYITRVHAVFDEADAFLPEFNMNEWTITNDVHQPVDEKHKYSFDILTMERKRQQP